MLTCHLTFYSNISKFSTLYTATFPLIIVKNDNHVCHSFQPVAHRSPCAYIYVLCHKESLVQASLCFQTYNYYRCKEHKKLLLRSIALTFLLMSPSWRSPLSGSAPTWVRSSSCWARWTSRFNTGTRRQICTFWCWRAMAPAYCPEIGFASSSSTGGRYTCFT